MAQLKDLIVNGPSRFIGDVYATTFTGDLNGNANTATSANTAAALTGKTLVTASAVTTSNWPTYADNHIPTMSFMAYWNGAYSGTSSNLAYCAQGAIIGSNNIGSQNVNYATTSGSCNGNAATATKATQDGNGNVITSTYLPLSGGILTGNMRIRFGDTDKFIMWDYDGDETAGASWRIGAKGTGSENTNYFCIESGTNDIDVNIWHNVLNIGQNDLVVYFSQTPKVGSTNVSLDGHSHNYLPLTGGTMSNTNKVTNLNADLLDGYHESNFTKTVFSAYSNSDDSMITCTDLATWISRLGSTGIISGLSSISTGAWWWTRSINFQVNNWDIKTAGAMIIHSGDGDSSHKDYKHLLILDAYGDLYGITSNSDWEYCTKFVKTSDLPTSLPASDVYSWAKQSTKPSYTGTEVTLSEYSKNTSYTSIASGDSVQAAIAKLEGAISGLEDLLASI